MFFRAILEVKVLTDNSLLHRSSCMYFCRSHRQLTNKGESPGIWQSKVVIERIGRVQWESRLQVLLNPVVQE